MEPLIYDKSDEEIRKIINKHNSVDVKKRKRIRRSIYTI